RKDLWSLWSLSWQAKPPTIPGRDRHRAGGAHSNSTPGLLHRWIAQIAVANRFGRCRRLSRGQTLMNAQRDDAIRQLLDQRLHARKCLRRDRIEEARALEKSAGRPVAGAAASNHSRREMLSGMGTVYSMEKLANDSQVTFRL